MKKFSDFNLKKETVDFIEAKHFEVPTPIQQDVIPVMLRGKDIVAISDTGTGKTHAFLIPLMEMIDTANGEVQAVITAPTRELATQIYNEAKVMMQVNPSLRVRLITGGIERDKMADSIKQQPHIVIGTPGRIKDLFLEQNVLRVDKAKTVVVDEADMTLEYGFLEDVDAICSRMKGVQLLAFSATIPEGLKPFLRKYMNDPKTIHMKSSEAFNPNIHHVLVPCKHKSYQETLLDIMEGFQPYVCLIFANTRNEASEIAQFLRDHDTKVVEIHGGLEARERKQAMKQLENLQTPYVVASDVASRGLDIEGITHVVSCGFPSELEFYIHRAGRTGRAGREGTCFALYQDKDEAAIRELMKRGIKFEHKSFKSGNWKELKPFGEKRVKKNDELEKEIAKTLTRKKEKVKPGYKKKKAAEIQRLKRKAKSEAIRKEVKAQKKEMFKKMQAEKNKRKQNG